MLTITAQLLDNKSIKLSKKNFGNKLDNSITKVIFNEIAEAGNLNNKYVAFLSPTSEIFLFPLNSDNSFIVTYTITQYAGAWRMLYLATNTAIEEGAIDNDYKVYVSNSIDFTITENFLTDIIEQPIIDDNLEIIYEQLNQEILYLSSEGFKDEIAEMVLANFELTEEQIGQIADNLKNDEEFKESVKGQSLYEYWLKDAIYNKNDRVNSSLKFYINKDLIEYLKAQNPYAEYQTQLFSISNYFYILSVNQGVAQLFLYSTSSLKETYTEEDILYNGVSFYNDNIIKDISIINNFNPLYKEEYLTVTEYTRKYGYELTHEDMDYVKETLKNDEEFKESVKGENGEAGRGIYTEYIELNSYEIGGIDSNNNFYWNKNVLEEILSKNGSYDGKIVLQTDFMTFTYYALDKVFNVYVNSDLSTRVDWVNITKLLSEEAPYVRLQNSTEITLIEDSLLLREPFISIEDYSSTYLKGEAGANGVDGKDGTDGKSSYQSWLDVGNTGTEEDFLESLKGEKGEKGDNGEGIYETWLNSIILKENDTIESTQTLYLNQAFYDLNKPITQQLNLFFTDSSTICLGVNIDTYDNIEKVYHISNGAITVLSTVTDALSTGFKLPNNETFVNFNGEYAIDSNPVYKDKYLSITEYSETYLRGVDGVDGVDGYTPVKGTDYWTEEDITEIQTYCKNYIDTEILGGAS